MAIEDDIDPKNKENAKELGLEWNSDIDSFHQDLAYLSSARLKELALLIKNNPNVTIVNKVSRYNISGKYMGTNTSKEPLEKLLKSVLASTNDEDSDEERGSEEGSEKLIKSRCRWMAKISRLETFT